MGQACTPVLILDHEPAARDYAARVAENAGYLATEVAHAGEAFSALEAEPAISAVIAASQWGSSIDGIALAGTIRSFWPQLAIVLLAERALAEDADLPHGTVVVTKPFTPSELVDAIGGALLARSSIERLEAYRRERQAELRLAPH